MRSIWKNAAERKKATFHENGNYYCRNEVLGICYIWMIVFFIMRVDTFPLIGIVLQSSLNPSAKATEPRTGVPNPQGFGWAGDPRFLCTQRLRK